jgi:hypothetical protein
MSKHAELTKSDRKNVRWFLFWLMLLIVFVPLASFISALVYSILGGRGGIPGWELGVGLATMITMLKWMFYPDMGVQPRAAEGPMSLVLCVKVTAIGFASVAAVGGLVHGLRGRPSWTLILTCALCIPLSFVVASLLIRTTNYHHAPPGGVSISAS